MFSCEHCKIFKNTYFEEHQRMAASKYWDIFLALLIIYDGAFLWK